MKFKPKFNDIDWEMTDYNHPPENVFRMDFMQAGLWDTYNDQIGKISNISYEKSVEIAKKIWRQYCSYHEKHEPTEIQIKDKSVEKCEVVHTKDEPVISMMVTFPGGGGTEILISREELLYMIDGLNAEW